MSQPRAKPARTLSDVLAAALTRAEREEGRKISPQYLSTWVLENHRVGATDETIRSYHDGRGDTRKKNPLLIAALADFYGLKLSDLPAEEAERITTALKLLKRVSSNRRTPPGTRTRNLQDKGTRQHPSSARFVTKDTPISQVEAA